MQYNELSEQVIGAAIEVHRHLGPGLLEGVYESAMLHELSLRKLNTQSQLALPLHYKGKDLATSFRIDLQIENKLIVEIKAVETILPVHKAQLLSYLRLAQKPLGLLINFNSARLIEGTHRIVNHL